MIFYELMLDGFHTPLTREEIAELYHAGRVVRNSPCKLTAQSEWRTVDELFPLLKHDWPEEQNPHESSGSGVRPRVAVGVGVATIVILAAALVLGWFRIREPEIAATEPPRPKASSPATYVPLNPTPHRDTVTGPPIVPGTRPSAAALPGKSRSIADLAAQQARWEQERLAREQLQREQAANADRLRSENERGDAEKQQATGTDTIVLLDAFHPVNVGGWTVSVKVHENDVTSFDVWINGARYRDLKKEKGITQSGTDETFIYRNGRASLYYVWELSGKLNHCRLRVREG